MIVLNKNISVSNLPYCKESPQFLAAKPTGRGKRLLIHRYILYLKTSAQQEP
jgi:hypothetical protein